jgi:hypothetical protein
MKPEDVSRRLRAVSEASDLKADRLETKIDMSPDAVTARLREVAMLLEACLALSVHGAD